MSFLYRNNVFLNRKNKGKLILIYKIQFFMLHTCLEKDYEGGVKRCGGFCALGGSGGLPAPHCPPRPACELLRLTPCRPRLHDHGPHGSALVPSFLALAWELEGWKKQRLASFLFWWWLGSGSYRGGDRRPLWAAAPPAQCCKRGAGGGTQGQQQPLDLS